ncbi:FtsX-like permease family protein [Catellatospora tritici]|uniref:FtsX-like permease family protein n=1 Tax=Catellatospora tritici TaxID=2851566 RepID=UPI001C2CEDE0|nr:FtsX-like permease family protein [Catellatospora tritici]MBV1852050.1 ABC transporter permease [Catellatospora tritici]
MLVWRRANSARSLLAAAAAAALIATVLLAGLVSYNSAVVEAGGQAAVAAAPPSERSILVRGPADSTDAWTTADTKVREWFSGGLGGAQVDLTGAGYASGRQFSGATGNAVADSGGLVFAQVMFLDALPEHAELRAGTWAVPGSEPAQAVLGEAAARIMGVQPGARVPITDRRSGKVTEVVVTGVFAPKHTDDPYWLLTPELAEGSILGGSTYGPLVFDRADFFGGGWAANGSAGWIAEPRLAGSDLAGLVRVSGALRGLTELPKAVGFGSSGQTTTNLDRLVERLKAADLVGRSALLTPMLLTVVLGGYALMLLAALLTEQRRPETALLRARGAARGQLAGLAAREAVLVALPAVVVAPPLAGLLLGQTEGLNVFREVNLHPDGSLTASVWLVALAAGAGCVLAMMLPTLKAGGTYVADLAARSRPSRGAAVQRAGADLALIGFAILAWFQLRQYDSPLAGLGGKLGIDPLLASAAPIGVLAGAVLALRLLPPLTRLIERLLDRRPWFATQLGMWQAGRRPHAGPVLLLALAVAVSTLAWTLAATSERSNHDQADQVAGADLRLTESSGFDPAGRTAALNGLPGVRTALPVWRTSIPLGEKSTPSTLIAIDAAAATDVIHLRNDLGDMPALLRRLAAARLTSAAVELPAGTAKLRGTLRLSAPLPPLTQGAGSTDVVLYGAYGQTYRVALSNLSLNGTPTPFEVAVPEGAVRLAGFMIDGFSGYDVNVDWSVKGLATVDANGTATPLSLRVDSAPWQYQNPPNGAHQLPADAVTADELTVSYPRTEDQGGGYPPPIHTTVARTLPGGTVPALATTAALDAMHEQVGGTTTVRFHGVPVRVKFVGSVPTLPGVADTSAVLLDLPSLSAAYFDWFGGTQGTQEWWLTTDPAQHAAAAAAAGQLTNLRVTDRTALADQAGHDPYGVGARLALFIAALGAIALALVGVAVDVRATARRRIGELAVLHTLGATPRLLAGALIVEQAFLAGLGVTVGLVVGIGVAATMAPLVILTPSAARPVPAPLLSLDWAPVLGTSALLLVLSMAMAGLIATTMRQRLAAAQLRIGADR